MRSVSISELRNKSAQIWRELPNEREIVVTRNGCPIAILTAVDENSFEESLKAWRKVRAEAVISKIQRDSVRKGTDRISMDEIDAEIKEARLSRGKRCL